MYFPNYFFLLSISLSFICTPTVRSNADLKTLIQIKTSVDPRALYLSSWVPQGDPCGGTFVGVACNDHGKVANISLQGKGLDGVLPSSIGDLKSLSGLYLHFNRLNGNIPKEIAGLTHLTDLYLDVNNFSGSIPVEVGNMSSLQVLQLCYNNLSGNVPTHLGSLKQLKVLALHYNQLTGSVPASLGDLGMLTRLDLSFNKLFGSIPAKLAEAPSLRMLDIRHNTLSGTVPIALQKLSDGFRYENNPGLCGVGFASLRLCSDSPSKPKPFVKKDIPESANLQINCTQMHCSNPSKKTHVGVVSGIVIFALVTVFGISMFTWYRRHKQKIGSTLDSSNARLSTDQAKEVCRRSASPLISVEYSSGWDSLGEGSDEVTNNFMFNLEDIESSTQHFSEVNFLGRSNYSAVYKGVLRDGSLVAIKRMSKTSCKPNEDEFFKGVKILTSLKHVTIVKLRGVCYSKGRGECFLIYDFVPNGNLLEYLDLKISDDKVLEWSTRVSIIKGIAKGIDYLHTPQGSKPALVHQNISAEKVLIDWRFTPLLLGSCLHKLLADDIVFSMLKASAATGYLAPEYTTTGKLTEKSDIYSFGILVFQILSGKTKIDESNREGAQLGRFEDFIDMNLNGKFLESEADKLGKIALLCTHELPYQRPTINGVRQELSLLLNDTS